MSNPKKACFPLHTLMHTHTAGVWVTSSPLLGAQLPLLAGTASGRCGCCHFMCTHAAPYNPLKHAPVRKHPRRAHTHTLSVSPWLLHPMPSGSWLGAGYPQLWRGGCAAWPGQTSWCQQGDFFQCWIRLCQLLFPLEGLHPPLEGVSNRRFSCFCYMSFQADCVSKVSL